MGPGRGAGECAQGHAGWGGASRPGTLTELLQLRRHGLGAQRERCGRGALGGRGSCRQTGETSVRPTLAAMPPTPTHLPGPPGRRAARAGGALPGRQTDVGKLAVSAASTQAVMAWDQAGSSDGPGQAPGHTRHSGSLPSCRCGPCRGGWSSANDQWGLMDPAACAAQASEASLGPFEQSLGAALLQPLKQLSSLLHPQAPLSTAHGPSSRQPSLAVPPALSPKLRLRAPDGLGGRGHPCSC